MKRILKSFLLQILFWMFLFILTRAVFLVFHLQLLVIEKIPFGEVISVFLYGLKLDLATACYFMLIPFLILTIQSFRPFLLLTRINQWYTYILTVFYVFAATGETGIYAEWKTKLTYKVIKYLANPSEIYNSAETGQFFLLLLIFLVISALAIFTFRRFFFVMIERNDEPENLFPKLAFMIITPGLLFLGLRGGWQQIPINQSESYFSRYNILNLSAVNTAFNLYISIFENLQNFDRNPYVYMSQEDAATIMDKIYRMPCDSSVSVLSNPRPNIVMFILESWSADLIEDLGGEPGITPEFKKLQKEGILFTDIYASGSRSEQAMASIFSAFPSHPVSSVTVQPDKFVKLPSLVHELKNAGYQSAFYFGGQLIYGNIKSYIYFNQFNKIMEIYDFPKSLPQGKLGIHDQYTFQYMAEDLGKLDQPFLAAIFSLSTHSPWDQPFEKPLKWGDNEQEYINAAYYTDHCLGVFFRKVRSSPWYDNTLFIIVADHSHNSYRNWHPQSREYHRIPMLFLGNVIREEFRGTAWNLTGNQHDIAATILRQLNLDHTAFRYSKDLLNRCTPPFAYYTTEDGMGWVSPRGYYTFETGPAYYYWWTTPNLADSVIREGKAYLQTVFSDYLEE